MTQLMTFMSPKNRNTRPPSVAEYTQFPVNDPNNVHVDHENRTVFLSTIFKWYKKDFINDLRAKGRPGERGLIDYVAGLATGSLRADLDRADGYEVEFRDYDWSLNEAGQAEN